MSDGDFPRQGLLADPNSTVPIVQREGVTVAIFDVVWRSGDGSEVRNVRGYAHKTLTINRVEVEDEEYIYRSYKAYFSYRIGKGDATDLLENEYNCKASEDETSFYDFTFLRQGQHSDMEKPRFFFPDPPVLDEVKNPFLGLCMVFRKASYEQEIVSGWAKLRDVGETWETSERAELTDKEYEMLTNPNGVPKGIHQRECFDYWFRR